MGESDEVERIRLSGDKAWQVHFKGMESEDVTRGFLNNLEYNIAKDKFTLTDHDTFLSLAFTVRERLIERWILTQQQYHYRNSKRVYYLSFEFLMGRMLENNIINLEMGAAAERAMGGLELSYEDIIDQEPDAGLGNGGLGRLAACFLDSMATMALPAIGYGIRYEFGIFKQVIVNGEQRELPDEWLKFGDPWGIERPEARFKIRFYGRTQTIDDGKGVKKRVWLDTKDMIAIPYDLPIPGYGNDTVNTLRLWSAHAENEFSLEDFNVGDYIGSCEDKLQSENISKVLYPNDNNYSGRELRLKQQHFFTSASIQDIIRRYQKENDDFGKFPDKVAIQINDTHPALAILEFMRVMVDEYDVPWAKAWDATVRTFAYTNHTLLPEALEKWPVWLFEKLLPRHLEIAYDINAEFLRLVSYKFPNDPERLRRMSLIEEGPEKRIRMAYLAIVGSHSVNGVAALHTELLKNGLVRDFYEMWPEKFNNKTNGITQRRWLLKANPALAALISSRIGKGWVRDLDGLAALAPLAEDAAFRAQWRAVKRANKERLAAKLAKWHGIELDPATMFDVQVKRIHEYKRQLLAVLHCIALYDRIKSGRTEGFVPRTILIGGKAAPGYWMAKLIVKFVNNVSHIVNEDPATRGLLRMHFLPDYRVSLAEYVMPAAELSEQISTAGTEASGTGNMKFALNGALTVGTMDGANIEIREKVGKDNIFIFGLDAAQVEAERAKGYDPAARAAASPELSAALALVAGGFFSPQDPGCFKPLLDAILVHGDRYMIAADFDSYLACQDRVAAAYRDEEAWARMSILNVAGMGPFSSDRTIAEYAREIWKVEPVDIDLEGK